MQRDQQATKHVPISGDQFTATGLDVSEGSKAINLPSSWGAILFSERLKLAYLMTQRSDYISKGYCIYRTLVPENLIDAFLAEYKSKITRSPDFFYRQGMDFGR
jgi:hypothetical protein